MKTILLSGFAAIGLLASNNASAGDLRGLNDGFDATDKMALTANGHKSDSSNGGNYDDPAFGPAMQTDRQAYEWGDENNVVFAGADGSRYRYEGDWQGNYVDPEGRVFEGEWNGRVIRHESVAGAGYPAPRYHESTTYGEPPHDDIGNNRYDVPRGYEGYEHCLKSSGLSGAAIGALLGGFAGNRVAGRGDRLGGTLVGAGIGGLLGVAVERANDRCGRYRPGDYRPVVAYPQHRSHSGHYSWQGGQYHYPAMTVIVSSGAITTTTITEEITYEPIHAATRKRVMRKWKAKPKPRCVC